MTHILCPAACDDDCNTIGIAACMEYVCPDPDDTGVFAPTLAEALDRREAHYAAIAAIDDDDPMEGTR